MSAYAVGPWAATLNDGEYLITNVLSCGNTRLVAIARHEGNAKLLVRAPDLLDDLKLAAETLRRYEQSHRAKGTEESTAKAEVNAELATRFEATIRKATA